ncbi:MAG: hypothetical protein SVM80_12815 [Halobacteriota archaeon]|nr:hypothetical protein [Halobacteriota archaeon]
MMIQLEEIDCADVICVACFSKMKMAGSAVFLSSVPEQRCQNCGSTELQIVAGDMNIDMTDGWLTT